MTGNDAGDTQSSRTLAVVWLVPSVWDNPDGVRDVRNNEAPPESGTPTLGIRLQPVIGAHSFGPVTVCGDQRA